MTVRCPQCATRYRLPPRSRLARNATFRCSRCGHVFGADDEAEAPAVDDDEREESFQEEDDDEPVFTIEPTRPDVPNDPEEDEAMLVVHGSARSSQPPRREVTPARFAVRALCIVTLAYGVLTIYLHTHPARVRELLAGIPFVGEEMSESRLSPRNVQLTDVRGEFQRVHGDRLVFVITGTAINNAPVAVAGIQIEGRILGTEDHRQVVYVGAAPHDVTELGIREIELLQTLKPSSDWVLPPGGQDRFLVAFVDPPVPATEFAAEVIAVRGTSGRPDNTLAKRP